VTRPERDSLSDRILDLLERSNRGLRAGMFRQELIEALGEDWTWEQISAALESLVRLRRVAVEQVAGGYERPEEAHWRLMWAPQDNGPLRDAPAGE
jgi:hypothetical protein